MTNREPPDPKEPQITKDNSQKVDIKPYMGESIGAKTVNNSQQIGIEQNKSQVAPPPVGNPPAIPPISTVTAPSNLYPQISIDLIQNPSRFYAIPFLGIFIKIIILFPVFLYLGIMGLGLSIGAVINSFVVLSTGKYWKTAYRFNLGWFRLSTKVKFFLFGLTNKYPGFSRQINNDFSLDLEYPEKSSRFFAIPLLGGAVRWLFLIPFIIYNYIVQYAVYIGVFLFSWPYAFIRGRYPESTFELTRDQTRLNLALYAYTLGLSDKYPSFRISMHHKIKKLLLIGTTVILLTLNYTYPYILNYFYKDIPPIDDRDLQLVKVDVPREQNAFYDLVEIDKYLSYPPKTPDPIQDHITGKVWDEQFVQETLAKNEQALALFDEAVKKPSFQNPKTADPTKILSTSLKIARLSSLKALSLARQNKDAEALNEAIKSVEIGQKIQESQVGLIDYLIGIAIKQIGLSTLQKLVAVTKLPPETLIQDAKYLEKFKNNEEGLKTAFKVEYALAINSIDSVASGDPELFLQSQGLDDKTTSNKFQSGLKNNFYFQPNKTKALFASYIRPEITNVSGFCSSNENREFKRLFYAPSSSLGFIPQAIIKGNSLGLIFYDALGTAWNFDGQIDKRCREDFLVSSTQILFALRAYNLETGGYPATLNELVPKYLSKVPEDPFDGKPIKYSPTKKILYSVGKDRIDSGGSEGDDWTQMPDPTFKIEF